MHAPTAYVATTYFDYSEHNNSSQCCLQDGICMGELEVFVILK